MPINLARLSLLNPVTSVKEKYLSSQQISTELIRAVMGEGDSGHLWTLGEERLDRNKYQEVVNKTKLKGLV